MSSKNAAPAFAIPERTVPLPERPNLEFERKRAKHMLRTIVAGDAPALERVRRYHVESSPQTVKLSDVQLTIAREYGFPSWPKLVDYFETWHRHERTGPMFQSDTRRQCERRAEHFLYAHSRRQTAVANELAAFVPRFYGRSNDEIFATPITREEAQLAAARMQRFSSWQALIDYSNTVEMPPHTGGRADGEAYTRRRYGGEYTDALNAIRQRDLASFSRIAGECPELLRQPPSLDWQINPSLLRIALQIEQQDPSAETRAISDWLIAHAEHAGTTLSSMFFQPFRTAADVTFLLDRGADPNWIAPNGVSALEYGLLRYWNSAAVDVIAKRAQPKSAFWIAAGLGDVAGMLGYLDRNGRPTSKARRDRPDLTIVGLLTPCRPDADDLEILWEGFMVAGFNQRLEALDALLDRGFPVDYALWGSTLAQWAEGNRFSIVAEHLVKRGARLNQ